MTALPTFAGHTMACGIKMFRSLEQRDLMQFVDYQEVLSAKDRVRRSRITDAGRAALAELTSQTVDAATS